MDHHNTQDPLRALDRGIDPPPSLEARVRRTLRTRGLLRPRFAAGWRPLGAAAAAIVIFVLGYAAGQAQRTVPPAPADGNRYALFLYEDATFDSRRPEEELVAEYSVWAAGLRARGLLEAGEKLDAAGLLLEGGGDSTAVASRDVASNAGALVGLFVIRAADDAEALSIAATCPHLRYGGRVQVRAIVET